MSINHALMSAWTKIQEYCKERYHHVSTRDIQIRWKHNVYGWTEFGVTPDGSAYIVHGNHSQSPTSPNAEYHFHPQRPTRPEDMPTRFCRLEEVVKDWPIIKEKLEDAFSIERRIQNFEA